MDATLTASATSFTLTPNQSPTNVDGLKRIALLKDTIEPNNKLKLTLINRKGNQETSYEIVDVTRIQETSPNTFVFTIQRGRENTTAVEWVLGTPMEARLTAGQMNDLIQMVQVGLTSVKTAYDKGVEALNKANENATQIGQIDQALQAILGA